ncbi:15708_t:CDS:1, partial [Racocetra persica]
EREILQETGIVIFQEKLLDIGYSYYPSGNPNRYNNINATETKTYIHPSCNQTPMRQEENCSE